MSFLKQNIASKEAVAKTSKTTAITTTTSPANAKFLDDGTVYHLKDNNKIYIIVPGKGQMIETPFSEVFAFSDGYAVVKQDSLFGLIKWTGEDYALVLPTKFTAVEVNSGVAYLQIGEYNTELKLSTDKGLAKSYDSPQDLLAAIAAM